MTVYEQDFFSPMKLHFRKTFEMIFYNANKDLIITQRSRVLSVNEDIHFSRPVFSCTSAEAD